MLLSQRAYHRDAYANYACMAMLRLAVPFVRRKALPCPRRNSDATGPRTVRPPGPVAPLKLYGGTFHSILNTDTNKKHYSNGGIIVIVN